MSMISIEDHNEIIAKLKAENERLKAENERLKAAQEWRGMESAPKDGTFVLVIDSEYGDHSGAFVAQYSQHSFSGCWLTSHTPHVVRPTHWMPLPTPPIESDDGEFVFYDEAQAEIDALKAQNADLLKALQNLTENVVFYHRNGISDLKDAKADRNNAVKIALIAIGIEADPNLEFSDWQPSPAIAKARGGS